MMSQARGKTSKSRSSTQFELCKGQLFRDAVAALKQADHELYVLCKCEYEEYPGRIDFGAVAPVREQ